MLTKDAILAAKDLQIETVDVPEWGGKVHIRPFNGAERDTLEAAAKHAQDDMRGFRARIVAASICNDAGELLFEIKDIPALNNKSAAALNRVCDAALRLNHMTPEDVDDLTKN